MPLIVGDAGLALRICEAALEQGVFAQAIRPPTVPDGTSRLRLAVMASHTRAELRDAARILAQAALRNGLRPSSTVPVAAAQTAPAPAGPAAGVRRRRRGAAAEGGVTGRDERARVGAARRPARVGRR